LARLRGEALREMPARVPAHHAADENHLAARLDAVGIAFRPRPALGMQDDVAAFSTFVITGPARSVASR